MLRSIWPRSWRMRLDSTQARASAASPCTTAGDSWRTWRVAGWLGRRVLQSGGRIKTWRIDQTGQAEGWAAQASVLADALHRPGDAGGTGRTICRGCTSSAAPAPNGAHKTPSFIADPGCRAGHPALDRRAPAVALGGTAQASGARSPFRPSTRWPRKLGM